jgi:hypothetical protein
MERNFPDELGATGTRRAWLDALRLTIWSMQDELAWARAKIASLEEAVAANRTLQISEPSGTENPSSTYESISSNTTLTTSDVKGIRNYNCTSACTITLPEPFEGASVTLWNRGTATLTVNNNSAEIVATLPTDSYCTVIALSGDAGAPRWPTSVPTMYSNGCIETTGPVIVRNTDGVIVKDGADHYWSFSTNTSGALVTTDEGTDIDTIRADKADDVRHA